MAKARVSGGRSGTRKGPVGLGTYQRDEGRRKPTDMSRFGVVSLDGGQSTQGDAPAKELEKAEDEDCIGGLRCSHKSAERVPGCRMVGLRLRLVLLQYLAEHPEVEKFVT
eukprot:2187278-Amphidinium_carterae.1